MLLSWLSANANKNGFVCAPQLLVRCAREYKPSALDGSAVESQQSITSKENLSRKLSVGDCATARTSFAPCVGSGLNKHVVSCCVLCIVSLSPTTPPPCRTRTLQLPFSQSTPLPPARHLTRWPSLLRRGVRAPARDLPLNPWPTHPNLTLPAHRAKAACSSHTMGRWSNKNTIKLWSSLGD